LTKIELVFENLIKGELIMELENGCTLEDVNEFLNRKRVVEKSVNIVYSTKRQGPALDRAVTI
jgi:hypothetical protein